MFRIRTIIKSSPAIISLIYISAGIIWILYSDQLVRFIFEASPTTIHIQSMKWWFFLIASTILIFILVYQSNTLVERVVKAAKKNEDKFEATFEYAPIGIAHHKPNEKWIMVNRSLCNLLGYSKDELLNLDFDDFIHPDYLELGRMKDQEILDGKISKYKMEKKYKRKDGTYFPAIVSKGAVYNDNNETAYLITTIEDITHQKQNEQMLEKSLDEKEILLSEVHHRVKNNLALMSALIELQYMHTTNKELSAFLEHYKTRLKTMSLIYENFSGEEKEPVIDFSWYLYKQIDYLNQIFDEQNSSVDYQIKIDSVQLNINLAIPVGLICNELLINATSLEYDKVEQPSIKVSLSKIGDKVVFVVKNNGKSSDRVLNLNDPNSLDSHIIDALVKQIEGNVSMKNDHDFHTSKLSFVKGVFRGAASYKHHSANA